ncbi:MAG: hypothetical protein ABSG91_20265, partial [Syntrophobacteraceae bacterium]
GGATAQQIAGEALRQGVDPSTALTIWSAEGGVTNPATQNPTSFATGIFQHTAGTWSDLGGTDQNRTDGRKQIELGVALTRQNIAALTRDLGRRPQPREVYLAHQQGIAGATALIHADPDENACDVVGNPKAITLNGGTPDMTAGQFLNYIKDYTDKHSMMYAPDGTTTAQNLSQNYAAGLEAVRNWARQEYPGDPAAEDRYVNFFENQAGHQIGAWKTVNNADWAVINKGLNGPNGVASWNDFNADPSRYEAYLRLYKNDPAIYDHITNAINVNAFKAWDPPATAKTNQLYDNLNGMKDTARAQFTNLNLMPYYGGMPLAQLNSLIDAQDKIRKNDPTEAAKHTALQSSLVAVKDITKMAQSDPDSQLYRIMPESPLFTDQRVWNGFVSKFGQALDDWQQNNNSKIPTDMQKREIAQGILFPNGAPNQSATAPASPGDYTDNRDPFGLWVAQHLQAHGRLVSDETISAAKNAMIAQNPNIEREYSRINIVPVRKAGE